MISRSLIIVLFCLIPFSALQADNTLSPKVCMVISREIRPFLMMADELENNLYFPVTRIFLDSSYRPYGQDGKFREILTDEFTLFIAVGPRALSYLLQQKISTQIIYGMVVHPELIIKDKNAHVSGVSLNIFSLTQLTVIKQIFPDIKRIGVLYDPENNRNWFNSARLLAKTNHISLIPLKVSDSYMIQSVLDDKATDIDGVLFIPDATVISTTIIKHAIKQLLSKKIPAIGYNSFFSESGAVLSFVIDYKGVGKQVANQVYSYLKEQKKLSVGATFKVSLNQKVIQLLGLTINPDLPESVEFTK